MPQKVIKEYFIYTYDELSAEAKQKAREWYTSDNNHVPHDWYEDVYNIFKEMHADPIGLDIEQMSFSGFYSQGDGAAIVQASIDLEKMINHIYTHDCPDKKHLLKLVRLEAFTASVIPYNFGYSSYSHGQVSIDLNLNYNKLKRATKLIDWFEKRLENKIKELEQQLYKDLESDYEGFSEDETVEDNIIANEYTFDEQGNRKD